MNKFCIKFTHTEDSTGFMVTKTYDLPFDGDLSEPGNEMELENKISTFFDATKTQLLRSLREGNYENIRVGDTGRILGQESITYRDLFRNIARESTLYRQILQSMRAWTTWDTEDRSDEN